MHSNRMLLVGEGFENEARSFASRIALGANASVIGDFYANAHLAGVGVKRNGSVITLPVHGVIGYGPEYSYYGGTSLLVLRQQVEEALADSSIESICLAFNSGGGYTTNVEQTALFLREASAVKPINAIVTNALSAAYWLASACSQILATGESTYMGSIGVKYTHLDYSKQLESDGVKATEFVSTPLKGIGSEFHAPSEAENSIIQGTIDAMHNMFVSAISSFRGIDIAEVSKVATGVSYLASDAVSSPLYDGYLKDKEILMTVPTAKPAESNEALSAALSAITSSIAALNDRFSSLEGTTKTLTEASALLASNAATANCHALYTNALKRAPTEAEAATYVALDSKGRTALDSVLSALNPVKSPEALAALTSELATSSNLDTTEAKGSLAKAALEAYKLSKGIK